MKLLADDKTTRMLSGPPDPAPSEVPVTPTMLCLLGGPHVVQGGRRIVVPEGSKRVLVFVALHDGVVDRRYVAGTLWPDGCDERAAGNLRSALWRLRGAGIDILETDKCGLTLRPRVAVDVRRLRAWAAGIFDGTLPSADLLVPDWDPEALSLLPGWYDDWVIVERERLRQGMLHALEALSYRLSELGRHAAAVDAAMRVVEFDPLRESGQRALISAHLAEGNLVEARRTYAACRRVLHSELGLAPSLDLTMLVEPSCEPIEARARFAPDSSPGSARGVCPTCPLLNGQGVNRSGRTR
ncbi:MAG TPA: BTAD domain-containing putative transcriptional regulator [Microlunatus sp.]